MINNDYKKELEYLKKYDISKERKIRFIESLYRLANYNFNEFMKNWGKIDYLDDDNWKKE